MGRPKEMDRRDGAKDAGLDEFTARRITEAYMRICMEAIDNLVRTPDELREWWRINQEKRERYGLSRAQINRLVQACKDRVQQMETRAQQVARIQVRR